MKLTKNVPFTTIQELKDAAPLPPAHKLNHGGQGHKDNQTVNAWLVDEVKYRFRGAANDLTERFSIVPDAPNLVHEHEHTNPHCNTLIVHSLTERRSLRLDVLKRNHDSHKRPLFDISQYEHPLSEDDVRRLVNLRRAIQQNTPGG